MTAKKIQSGVTKPKKAVTRKPDSDWDSEMIAKAVEVSGEQFEANELARRKSAQPTEPEFSTDKIDLNDLVAFLRENLRLEVDRGHFTDPNNRRINLMLGDTEITSASFDIVQQREYEG